MLPFLVDLTTGQSVSRQVVYAATRAVVSGELVPGQPFPSVRELSQALKINPNTAHKIVAELVREGLLHVVPGMGTVVAEAPPQSTAQQSESLERAVEALVVDARRAGVSRAALVAMIAHQWKHLFGARA